MATSSSVQDIVTAALREGTQTREAFVKRACNTDELRKEVESLLGQLDRECPILSKPIFNITQTYEPTPQIQPGDRIDHYKIISILARGGMSTVALAEREEHYEKRVAMKIASSGSNARVFRKLLEEERQLLAKLNHPNIAQIYDAGFAPDSSPYYVMEYVNGEPIHKHCLDPAIETETILEYSLQICSALQAAHENKIIHRDLKPDNIYITKDRLIKILDFGIAKGMDQDEPSGATSPLKREPMTLRYASPEQVRFETPTLHTDIYSLGVVLYELISGSHPYPSATSTPQLRQAILEEEPMPPSARATDAPARHRRIAKDLDSILAKAMKKNVADRYNSISELKADLRRFLDGKPVLAHQHGQIYRMRKFVARNHQRILTVLLAMAIMTMMTTLAVFFDQKTKLAETQEEQIYRQTVEIEHRRAELRRALDLIPSAFASTGLDPSAAETHLLRALGVEDRNILTDPAGLSPHETIASKLIQILIDTGHYSSREEILERIEERLKTLAPTSGGETARILNNLAVAHFDLKNHGKAEALCLESLEVMSPWNEKPVATTTAIHAATNLAYVFEASGRTRRAREILSLLRGAKGSLYPETPPLPWWRSSTLPLRPVTSESRDGATGRQIEKREITNVDWHSLRAYLDATGENNIQKYRNAHQALGDRKCVATR